MKSMTELWVPVLLNDGIFKDTYYVSNMGRVKKRCCSKDGTYKFVPVTIINSKRPLVKMTGNGKVYRKSVAKLVLSSFDYREGCECANITYLDGNMKNCILSNLRYATDKSVYIKLELDKEINKAKHKVMVTDPTKIKMKKPYAIKKSCSSCTKNPCMTGMETLSTDFGAAGCNDYEPKENNNIQ